MDWDQSGTVSNETVGFVKVVQFLYSMSVSRALLQVFSYFVLTNES
jgi:hypothetical protein